MRIGIDCRLGGKAHAGIGRYIQNLVLHLPQLRSDVEWVLFCSTQEQAAELTAHTKSAHVEVIITPVRHYSLAEQVQMPRYFEQAKLDLLHVPHFNIPLLYRGPLVVTIHDLLWHEHKGLGVTTLKPWLYWLKYLAYRWVATAAVRRAQAIFVPAQTIQRTIAHYYPWASAKVVVTKEGAGEAFVGVKKTVQKKASSRKKSLATHKLVYVGSLYPHKNVKLVIDALKELPDYTLKIVGARTVFRDEVEHYAHTQGVATQVEFAGFLSDEKLLEEYESALALVQPSLSEGFGLTGIEAMAAGVPVLASDIPIFQEIYQDAAVFFDPLSVKSFTTAVKTMETLDRSVLAKKGQAVAGQYSWVTMARQTLGVYQQVVHKIMRQ